MTAREVIDAEVPIARKLREHLDLDRIIDAIFVFSSGNSFLIAFFPIF